MTARDASVVPPARTWVTLVPFLLAVAVVAGVGGLAAAGSQATYRDLELPPYAPPSWLFGPVWSVLYLLIGVAGWLLWRAGGWDRVLWLWTVQLVLNLLWTPLFFAADLYTVALVEIVVGFPRTLQGEIGPQARRVERFVEELRGAVDVPVRLWDERYSTAEAADRMAASRKRSAGRHGRDGRLARRRRLQQIHSERRVHSGNDAAGLGAILGPARGTQVRYS